jgi:alpha-L-rhamnosidase
MLNPDGTIYTTNLRSAASVDTYVCRGGPMEVWQPTFTFHGFRYVELTGLGTKPAIDAVKGIVIGSDLPRVGTLACSDLRINQLQSNIVWGQRGNYLSVPTDCPQRDERLGWMGDAQVFVRTATMNADVAAFFSKWLVDVDDGQSPDGAFSDVNPNTMGSGSVPAWADAGVICPWTIYQVYGDARILERHLPAMTRWVEYCRTHSTGLIRDKFRGNDYGDWLAIGSDTPKDVIGTAYFAYSTNLVAQSYRAIGKQEEAAKYEQLFQQIKAAFNKRYVAADGRIHGNTQCCYAMALKFDLLSDELRPKAAQYLADDIKARGWHLSTGFVGVSYLLPELTAAGRVDTAYRLLMQDTFPSWLFSVKHGATTIWERWDGWTPEHGFQDPGMNSFNHYSLGSCGQWLFDTMAGIGLDPRKPGYRHIIIHPRVGGGLTWAKATLRSIRGPIASAWAVKDGAFTLDVTIPTNTTAVVYIPARDAASVTESGKPVAQADGVKLLSTEAGEVVLAVQSGSYHFTAPQ